MTKKIIINNEIWVHVEEWGLIGLRYYEKKHNTKFDTLKVFDTNNGLRVKYTYMKTNDYTTLLKWVSENFEYHAIIEP